MVACCEAEAHPLADVQLARRRMRCASCEHETRRLSVGVNLGHASVPRPKVEVSRAGGRDEDGAAGRMEEDASQSLEMSEDKVCLPHAAKLPEYVDDGTGQRGEVRRDLPKVLGREDGGDEEEWLSVYHVHVGRPTSFTIVTIILDCSRQRASRQTGGRKPRSWLTRRSRMLNVKQAAKSIV